MKNKTMRSNSLTTDNKIQIFLLLLPILLIFICVLFSKLGPDWRYYTSPLPDDIKEDLCKKFVDTYKSEKLCSGENKTYGPDFYPYIEKKLLPIDEEGLVFETVQALLDPYLHRTCESLPKESSFSKVCTYDLRGDRVHKFEIYFNKNNNVDSVTMRVQTP